MVCVGAVFTGAGCIDPVSFTPPAGRPVGTSAEPGDNVDRQEHAAQRDEYKARVDAAQGNYRGAQREQDRAMDHQQDARIDQHRAAVDSR
jgi:hypothetical protein